MSFESPEAVVMELVTYTENDGDIYRRQTEPILKNLATKKARGDYDSEKAVQAFMYLAETGAREYARVFGGGGSSWHEMFPIAIRRMAAQHWRDEFEAMYAQGEYTHLLPKKYQPKPPTARKVRSKPQPTPEQARAVLHFASRHERAASMIKQRDGHRSKFPGWKQELSDCWMRSGYPAMSDENSALLQQVRNQLGPSWLAKVTVTELEKIASR